MQRLIIHLWKHSITGEFTFDALRISDVLGTLKPENLTWGFLTNLNPTQTPPKHEKNS